MGWPRSEEPIHKIHWRSKDLDVMGKEKPACKALGGFHVQPQMTKKPEEVTCKHCLRVTRGKFV